MALGATICKLELSVADIDRHYYESHVLTLAQHPSENNERLMLRVLSFILFADPDLQFGRGVSSDDEPDLWLRDDTGSVRRWIDLGMPDGRRVRRACGRAEQVELLTYGGSKADIWFQRQADELTRFSNLRIWNIGAADSRALAGLAARSMRLSATVQDGQVLIATDTDDVAVSPRVLRH